MNFRFSPGRKYLLLRAVARFALLGIVWMAGVCGEDARAQGVSDTDVKAAFLAKFPAFVKWPSSPSAITVGILGEDPFGGALPRMKTKRSKRIEDLKDCQILFISKSERGNLSAILDSLGAAGILTVGDSEGFAKQGGMIGFVIEGDKVRFEINLGAARRAGVTIDSQLLKLAIRIFGK